MLPARVTDGAERIITLVMKPISRLDNLRIWAAHYLTPKGWLVTPVGDEWQLDPAKVKADVTQIRQWLTLDELMKTHDIIGPHRCLCGWEGDHPSTHIIDVLAPWLEAANTLIGMIEDGFPYGNKAADEWFKIGCERLRKMGR